MSGKYCVVNSELCVESRVGRTMDLITMAVLNYGAYPRQAVHVERSLGGDRDIVEEAEALRGVGVGVGVGVGLG